jgi:plasmid stabilization system protein ParE
VSQVMWTADALADVQRLYRFLAIKDSNVARRAAQAIRANVKILAHQPQIGRLLEDMDHRYREWLIDFGDSGYVVLYRLEADNPTILAVRHQKEAGY